MELQVVIYEDGTMEAVNPAIIEQYIANGARVASAEESQFYWNLQDELSEAAYDNLGMYY